MRNPGRGQTRYRCQTCGYESLRWLGRCPHCQEWNTFLEETMASPPGRYGPRSPGLPGRGAVQTLSEVEWAGEIRFSTSFHELDRVLGGGVVPGSMILLGGEPGVGKSTLLLQVAHHLCTQGRSCLYVSGEESAPQLKLRAERLGMAHSPLPLLVETNVEGIEEQIHSRSPQCVVIDSIQTMFHPGLEAAPGTVAQIRESTAYLARLAKSTQTAFFIVGHVTKEGTLAGPKVMEHIVDTVLYLEGDLHQAYKVLRAVKNRFGSTNEVGLFEMQEKGFREILNPSQALLSQRPVGLSGTVVVCTMEGSRPLLVEVQALASPSYLGVPRRVVTGLDYNRVCLLLAVLEKRGGIPLAHQDVYVNVAGGLRILEPAVDLGVTLAVASSCRGWPIDPHWVVFGEVGLVGEVRAVPQAQSRLGEAARLGFTFCLLPESQASDLQSPEGLHLQAVSTLRQALDCVLTEPAREA